MHPVELAFWIIFAAIFGYVIVGFLRFFFSDRSFPSQRGTTRHNAGGAFGDSTGADVSYGTTDSSMTTDVSTYSSDISTDSGGSSDLGSAGGDFSGGGGDFGGGGSSGGWND